MSRQRLNSQTQLTGNGSRARVDAAALSAGQTVISISPATFEVASLEVYVGGILLTSGQDYTVNSASQITLNIGMPNGTRYCLLWNFVSYVSLASASPYWVTYTVDHAQLDAAALTKDIELFSLLAGYMIHNVLISHSVQFDDAPATNFTSYLVSVGVAGDLTKYASQFELHQAPGDGIGQISSIAGIESKGNTATSIRLAAVSEGANLNAATQGTLVVNVLISKVF